MHTCATDASKGGQTLGPLMRFTPHVKFHDKSTQPLTDVGPGSLASLRHRGNIAKFLSSNMFRWSDESFEGSDEYMRAGVVVANRAMIIAIVSFSVFAVIELLDTSKQPTFSHLCLPWSSFIATRRPITLMR